MNTTTLSMIDLAGVSAAKRTAIAQVDRGLADGTITIAAALTEHRDTIGHRLAFEVILKARGISRKTLAQVGEAAASVGVNLAKPVVALTAREILWITHNVTAAAPAATKGRRRTAGSQHLMALAA